MTKTRVTKHLHWEKLKKTFESRVSVFHCLGIISTYFHIIAMILCLLKFYLKRLSIYAIKDEKG